MNDVLAVGSIVYAVGAFVGVVMSAAAALSDSTFDGPRETFGQFGRRLAVAVAWPLALPLYLLLALRRDEW